MSKLNKKLIIAVLFLTALSAGAITFSPRTDIVLSVNPESPVSGESFKVGATSYVFDPLRANFQWYLNGKLISSGRGLLEQNFIATKPGTNMNITARAVSAEGTAYESSMSFTVADVDLIAHAPTYIPNWYRGASLATPKSDLEIYAVPHIYSGKARLDAKNLIYEWFLNGEKLNSQSGGGKSKISVSLPDFSKAEYDIELKVSNLSEAVSAKKSIKVKTQDPAINFYKTSELIGTERLAKTVFDMPAGGSISVIAEPFFMALNSLSNAQIQWTVNNNFLDNPPASPRVLQISAPEGAASASTFGIKISDLKTLFQRVEGFINVRAIE